MLEFPRRIQLDKSTPAELAIRAAVDAVEAAGAHPLLTSAVLLLDRAREAVADFVDGVDREPYEAQLGRLLGNVAALEAEVARLKVENKWLRIERPTDHIYATNRIGVLLAGLADGPNADAKPFIDFVAALVSTPDRRDG